MAAAQKLRDLHSIERRAFAQIVRYAPQRQTILHSRILAHAAHKSGVIAHTLDGRHIAAIFALIDQHDARRFPQDRLSFLG